MSRFNWQPCNSRRRSPSGDSFGANPEPPGLSKPSSSSSFVPPGISKSLADYPFGPSGTSKFSASRSLDRPPPPKPRNALFPSARLSVAAQGK